MTIPIANIYYLLCYAWKHVKEADERRLRELEELSETHHLLGKILAEVTFRLIRKGLDRGYREVREELPGIRGKLLVSDTAKRALRSRSRTMCEFEELSHDVLHNRILRSTLGTLLRLPDMDKGVRADIKTAYQKLEGISLVRLSRRLFRQVQLDRNRHSYRFLMSVCRLVHEDLSVEEGSGRARFFDFRKDEARMGKLFEDFVAEFYRREQSAFRVGHGKKIRWDDAGTAAEQRRMIPEMESDVLLESKDKKRRIILECKYYKKALSTPHRGTKKTLRSSHLYQLLAYLRNRDATKPGPRHEGILLYPMVRQPLRVDVCLEGFPIRARGIDLSRHWRNIHDDMLAVVHG